MSYAPMIIVVLSCVYAADLIRRCGGRPGKSAHVAPGRTFFPCGGRSVIGLGHSVAPVFVGGALWGCHLALTQGVFAKIIAEFTPSDLRGTGFAVFDLGRGIAFVIANTVAGYWWKTSGPPATFFSAAAFATIAGIGIATATRPRK